MAVKCTLMNCLQKLENRRRKQYSLMLNSTCLNNSPHFNLCRAIQNVRSALRRSTYDYFDEELYVTALEVFDQQQQKLSDQIVRTGKNLHI